MIEAHNADLSELNGELVEANRRNDKLFSLVNDLRVELKGTPILCLRVRECQ